MLLASAVLALVLAGVWYLVRGGGYRPKAGMVAMVLAGVIAVTGGTALSRAADFEGRALIGLGPGDEEPSTGTGLTGLGVFLFVSVPLFLVGAVVYGSG